MILNEGQKLVDVVGVPDADGDYIHMSVTGPIGRVCESIVVSMEHGQSGVVPWALCKGLDGKVHMINLTLVESVEIDASDQPEGE